MVYSYGKRSRTLSVLTLPHREHGTIFGLKSYRYVLRAKNVFGTEIVSSYLFFWRCLPISAKELQMNEDIKAKEVRVIGETGEQLGIMPSDKALAIAYERGYDLVMMSAQSEPPVCKIMDYGKYRFECEKREKEAKKKQQTVEIKEIQLSYRIDTHDFETKVRHALRFLSDGNKVKVVLKFKGREMSHMTMGKELMTKFREACAEMGSVDKPPVLDGRFMSMVIAPIKKK